jgi:hypothetical protein
MNGSDEFKAGEFAGRVEAKLEELATSMTNTRKDIHSLRNEVQAVKLQLAEGRGIIKGGKAALAGLMTLASTGGGVVVFVIERIWK